MDNTFVNVSAYTDEIDSYMPHFVFYRRGYKAPALGYYGEFLPEEHNRKLTDCYCTACHTRYEDGINNPKHYVHKEFGKCVNCGADVQFRQMNRGRQYYYFTRNFAVFEGGGDLMRIACIKAYQRFISDELEPELGWYTITQYELRPNRAVQFKYLWRNQEKQWEPKKTRAIEPNFARGFYWRDSNYDLINHECVSHSFLRYLFKGEIQLPGMYITWLCRYAEHPQLEYFLHGGVPEIAVDYVADRLGVRLNWKSNDMKKVLRLSKSELEYFMESRGLNYTQYIQWRKYFFQGKSDIERLKYFGNFRGSTEYIEEVEKLTGLPRKKIMDYALKHMNKEGAAFFMICYRDYLHECQKLQYNLNSKPIIMPKDLFTAHERTSGILAAIADKIINSTMHETDEKRRDLEVFDMELGLILRLPRSAKEISDEGAKLDHCVGGYADRHANGKLTIMFLRSISHPNTPYYTMEVTNSLQIEQCRGYRNNRFDEKPEIIIEFERRYSEYLQYVKKQRKKEEAKAKRKKRAQQKVNNAA